ncbi:sensor histidine kinase [Nocardia sienata]|uniref:sensor histidine kinase n=1 Tax=Nocardia sienata TaxID=248552 RepID=UPI000B21A94F|nr:histidine kinase [Nocardia sienata]
MRVWADFRGDTVRRWSHDALLGAAVAGALALVISLGRDGYRTPEAPAYLFAIAFGALMLVRRRAPHTMLVATVLGTFGYYTLDYPPIGVAVPLVAALFATADAGSAWWAGVAGTLVFAVALAFRIHEGESAAYLIGYEGVANAALIMTAIALGCAVRSRRDRLAQQAEIMRLLAEQSARQTESRIRDERTDLSRDLHDSVGHAMSVISLQAGVAAEAVGHDDEAARLAIGHIADTSRQSLRDVGSMVRLLRGEEEGPARVLSLAEVPDLIRTARDVGIDTKCVLPAVPDRLPPQLDATAYRVVQEALTNVICHARATRADVAVEIEDAVLRVTIRDNGTVAAEAPAGGGRGHGLAGMRERVRLLGGTLTAGPDTDSGFCVEARIPIEVSR